MYYIQLDVHNYYLLSWLHNTVVSFGHTIFCKGPLFIWEWSSQPEVLTTCSLLMVHHPGAWRVWQINTSFCLTFSFSYLVNLCCYSLFMISSSAYFLKSTIFVLQYFEPLVTSKVQSNALFKYHFLGTF